MPAINTPQTGIGISDSHIPNPRSGAEKFVLKSCLRRAMRGREAPFESNNVAIWRIHRKDYVVRAADRSALWSSDPNQRERDYSPSTMIGGDYHPFLAAYAEQSRQARTACPSMATHAYGAEQTQSLDLVVPGISGDGGLPPPLLVFIHGGYWQELSKRDSFFAAADCVRNGVAFAAIDYTLAPDAGLDRIVGECVAALDWLHDKATSLGFDQNRIFVSGSSAGAHLAAMTALGGLRPGPRADKFHLAGLVLVSGIYELEPLIGTSINVALGLDVDAARQNSPLLEAGKGFPASILCWGEFETSEFKRQSQAFASHLELSGTRIRTFEVAEKNHFDIILDLARPGTRLGKAVLDFVLEERSDHALL